MQVKCSKCLQLIAVSDVIESYKGRLSHLDCARRRTLTVEERQLLYLYCSDHLVARCLACGLGFRHTELAADPLGGGRTNLCPRCRTDLTENVRAHLYGCTTLPPDVRQRVQEVREAARRLIRQSQDPTDNADVLLHEAEGALFEAQVALRTAMSQRVPR